VVYEQERKKILAVDDNSAYLTICKKILKKFYDVYTVLSAEQMFDLLKQIKPDLILLDVLMPVMNGYEAARKLKSIEEFREIPVIFLTGIHDVQNEIEGFNIGAADYIHKPFNNSLLLQRIRTHLTLIDNQKHLETAMEEAKKAGNAKNEFLSRMSHEIRTPLNAVIGMLYIAKNTDDIEKIKNCIDKADAASSRLLSIINDILDMSKIEAHKLSILFSEFDFEKTLMNITNVINIRAEEKRQNFAVRLNSNVPISIISDELRLSQVITNLLSNAVKFTPEEGTVIVSVECTSENGDEAALKIEVEDTGIGISEEHKNRLFELFEQADADISDKYGGTGLGLAISKRIIDLMGGKISVESELGKGAKFTVTVNVKKGREKSWVDYGSNIKRSGRRILVIDGSKETRECFGHITDAIHMPCDAAENADEALKKIEAAGDKPYNIFFIDRDAGGVALASKIKRAAGDEAAIVLLTRTDWNDVEKDALNAGVRYFLPKPVFPSSLIDVIGSCTGEGANVGRGSGAFEPSAREGGYNFKNHTVLAVEDIEINREILSAMLENTGIAIDYAENGRIAVSMYEANPDKYSLVLMDVHMPEMDGYEATRAIRALNTAKAKFVPIVAMTANVFREDVDACLEAGMDDHIAKPIDPDILLEKIKKYKDALRLEPDKPEYDIAWNDALLTGNELVDGQHRHVFEILKDLIAACEDDTATPKLKETLAILADFTETHFKDEEDLQLRYNYPGYAKHKRIHEEFKDTISDIIYRFKENGSSRQLSGEVSRVVVRWMIGHIRSEDKRLCKYIQSVLDS